MKRGIVTILFCCLTVMGCNERDDMLPPTADDRVPCFVDSLWAEWTCDTVVVFKLALARLDRHGFARDGCAIIEISEGIRDSGPTYSYPGVLTDVTNQCFYYETDAIRATSWAFQDNDYFAQLLVQSSYGVMELVVPWRQNRRILEGCSGLNYGSQPQLERSVADSFWVEWFCQPDTVVQFKMRLARAGNEGARRSACVIVEYSDGSGDSRYRFPLRPAMIRFTECCFYFETTRLFVPDWEYVFTDVFVQLSDASIVPVLSDKHRNTADCDSGGTNE